MWSAFAVLPDPRRRLCELAVVAGEGDSGVHELDVVRERRNYASHLGLKLSGTTSNSDLPVHISWAVGNSNHNPDAKNRINLGCAYATFRDGYYRIVQRKA